MSIVAIGMNLMLAGLLVAALMMGMRLNGRLKALRDSHEGFAKAVADLDSAALRAEQGLADLRAATDEAVDLLADRIEKARALSQKLERQVVQAPIRAANEPRQRLERTERPERVDRNGDIDFSADVERVTHRLGSLLSAARDSRPARPEPERLARREAPRPRPQFEDELFGEAERPILRRERAPIREVEDDLVLSEREPLRMMRSARR